MSDPELDALARAARRARRMPPDAACATCTTREHLSVRPDGRVLCYADLQAERGVSTVEGDHLAGRANVADAITPLLANSHRTVTDWRRVVGVDDWPHANGDPLLVAAHLLAGLALHLLLIARWFVALAADAATRLGPSGWDGAPPAPVVP